MAESSRSRMPDTSTVGAATLLRLRCEVDRMFDDLFGGRITRRDAIATTPPINVSETDREMYVDVELPGVRDDAVQVDLSGELLTIRGEKSREHEDAQQHVAECSFGAFTRTVNLPFVPRPGDVRTTFERGVLHIVLPKPASQVGTHRIRVRAASSAEIASNAARGCFGGNAALAGHPTEATAQCGPAMAPVPK